MKKAAVAMTQRLGREPVLVKGVLMCSLLSDDALLRIKGRKETGVVQEENHDEKSKNVLCADHKGIKQVYNESRDYINHKNYYLRTIMEKIE